MNTFLIFISIIVGVVILYFLVRWLRNRRNLIRFVFAVACLATLIALFYAEENWRGKHALDKYKQAAEARGEKFDLKDIIPPAPPLDQNFATTPVIASCYEDAIDTSGHEVRPRRTDVEDRLEMPIAASDEKRVPANGNWTKGTTTDLSAWQTYYRHLANTTNQFPVPPMPRSPAADVLYALHQYDATLQEVRAASQLPYAQFPLEYTKENPAEILLPHLARLKMLARLLQFRSVAELQDNQSNQALADVQLSFFLMKSIRVEPFLISQLVRLAINDINLQAVYEGLADHRWTDSQLTALDAELAQLDFLSDFENSMRGERIFHLEVLEYLRRHRSLDMFDDFETSKKSLHPPGKTAFYLMPSGFFYRTELFFCQMHERWIFPTVDPAQHLVPPAKARESESALNKSFKAPTFQNRLASMLYPSLLAATKRFARGQSSVDLARVAIALERYRLAHGEFPDSLDALTPDFMTALPHDVINGKPLNYHRTADGQFTLYSVGWNETDDGGTRGTGPDNLAIFDTGDFVWSYPAK